MTLSEALAGNGVDAPDSAYDFVAIKTAPSWLRAVWPSGIKAMSLPKTIYVNAETLAKIVSGDAPRLLRHEAVHIEQWQREGRIGFLSKYLTAYLKGRAAGLPHAVAYRAIPVEREAVSRSE
jgi:hypothetical protein